MKIVTFNINGIKARIETLLRWLDEAKPDVVLLQEIKSIDENFPRELFEDRGYNVETHGQKSFNGVAILSRVGIEEVVMRIVTLARDNRLSDLHHLFLLRDLLAESAIDGLWLEEDHGVGVTNRSHQQRPRVARTGGDDHL